MKVAAATNDNITITGHVGRCRAFIVFEVNNQEIISSQIRPNTFTHHISGKNQEHQHHSNDNQGSNNHGHATLIDALKDCTYVLFQGGGWRLVEDLKAHNITPVLTSETDAVTAVGKLIKGELEINENLICRCH